MRLNKFIKVCIITILPYSAVLCQEATVHSKNLNKPFLTTSQNVPKWVSWGLMWPSSEEMAKQKISTSEKAQKVTETILLECLKSSWYEPNSVPEVITFRDRPDSNYVESRITQYERDGYIFHINDSNMTLFIGIKQANGRDIWDMNQDPATFVSHTIEKFFLGENIGLRADRKMFYVPNKDGTEGFYYGYPPPDNKDFHFVYLWTNGKIILLRAGKYFEENKKKEGGSIEDARW